MRPDGAWTHSSPETSGPSVCGHSRLTCVTPHPYPFSCNYYYGHSVCIKPVCIVRIVKNVCLLLNNYS